MKLCFQKISIVNADQVLLDMDLQIENGRISAIGKNLKEEGKVIDGRGLFAFPGFVDLHCHLRDPGLTQKEDLVSGTRSAVAGGFTTVCCMPNTQPALDQPELIQDIITRSQKNASAAVLPVAAITKALKGKELTDFGALKSAGAIAFSDDGMPVEDAAIMKQAMKLAKKQKILLMLHEEMLSKRGTGVVNDGMAAKKAGLSGIPNSIEDELTQRDIGFARTYNTPIHICHVSTKGSVQLVREAKEKGVPVTCEATPHHFTLTDEEILTGGTNTKVNPPLRSEKDRQAIIKGLMDGTIDAIATDHAPHTKCEKDQDFDHAPFGLIGFETAFSLAVTFLLNKNKVKMTDIARLMSKRPAEIIGIDRGELEVGKAADIAICDINREYMYTQEQIMSKAENTPFIGRKLFGKVVYTLREGEIMHGR